MNLAKMKEFENLKIQYAEKDNHYCDMVITRKTSYLEQAVTDFKNFFQEKGFSTSDTRGILKATYNTVEISMEIPTIEDVFVGAYSVLTLSVSYLENTEYMILLNELNHYPSITCTVSSSSTNISEDEKIEKEIKNITSKIVELDKNIKNFNQEKWGFGLRNKNEKGFDNKYPQFESIKELLESLFQ